MKRWISLFIVCITVLSLSGCSTAGGFHRSGKKHFAEGDYEQAANDFSNAIRSKPHKAKYYIDYGMSLVVLGQYEEAINQFDQVYMDKDIKEVVANNKRALTGKGIAYYRMREYKKGMELFDQALEIDELSNLDMDILKYKGSSLISIGDYKGARDIYDDLITNLGEDALIYNYLGYVNWQLGDYQEAIKNYDLAISLEEKNFQHYFDKYYLLIDIGNDAEASQVLEEASKIDIRSNEDKFQLARIHYYQEEYDTAFKEMSEAYVNGFPQAYYYIGQIHYMKEEYDSARYYYNKSLEEVGHNTPELYNQVGISLMEVGEYEEALGYLKQGIEIADLETKRILQKNKIVAYENIDRFKEAKEGLLEYIEDYPDDQAALKEMEFINSRLIH